MKPETDTIDVATAAAVLQTTQLKILMLLKNKALLGEEVGGEWYVNRDSLECYKAHGKDIKIEMGCKSYCSSGGCGCR
ncbi:hypothetical protein KI809_16695 [Geobacter pelophilus]|uniref:Helix-turn-helix domain-containing protein n=1 Tax=Geoanaerobacter pelophilus TaxID=60036 RepID=A0AAW4LFJ8_9BACT|nr:hypothetical protein [Geoanaerobacter pelophilus]MBT0665951.1 hypothetical protein [Geoanaerobacter pelophilus]